MERADSITLHELLMRVKRVVEDNVSGYYWIKAEISEIKYHPTGHCYLELCDKAGDDSPVNAKVQAMIWSNSYRLIKPYFETSTGYQLGKGMHILVKGQVQYSPIYGLSIVITDIDPSFTVGEAELQRQKTIKRLRDEGMMEMNSTIPIPTLPRRLAIVSSDSAAGYLDFMKHLHENGYGFRFQTTLFNSPMQGATAPKGIIESLDKIAYLQEQFDIVVIIRGGGSVQDLSCFDDYELCANIAQFPLPVITGIGHEQDFHIADMVAHTNLKTPTAAAGFLLDIFVREDMQISFLSRRLLLSLQRRMADEYAKVESISNKTISLATTRIKEEHHRLDIMQQRITMNNPYRLLERGFTIITRNDKRVTDIANLKQGDDIQVLMNEGTIECEVKNVVKHEMYGKE